MIVKVCGIKSLEDALGAIEAGADMLGFNFYPPSPRYLAPTECAALLGSLRQQAPRLPMLVGVFVNMPPAEIEAILDTCGLDLAQLHGDEPPGALDAFGGRAFKAIRPVSETEARALVRDYRRTNPAAAEILLDATAPGLYGGSGVTANWTAAASLAVHTKLLLAGGLHPGNVAQAVATVRPWGVDVASGVESGPGIKDREKMTLFVREAKGE